MLSNKHPSVVSKLESKAEAVHAADMDEWNMTLNDISLAKDVSQYVSIPLFWTSLTYLSWPGLVTPFLMLPSPF